MDKAQTTEEITALIMELPDRGPAITKDDPKSTSPTLVENSVHSEKLRRMLTAQRTAAIQRQ